MSGKASGGADSGIFGSTLVAIYIFLITGRVLDISPIWFLHIPLILLVLLTLTMISRGDFEYTTQSKLTRYFGFFTGWVILCFPVSSWRTASMPAMQMQVQTFVIFLIIVQVVRTRRDWEKVASAYAYAILAAAVLTFFVGINVQGRIALPGGTMGDPNEFALHMVLGLPFWWFRASRSTGFKKFFNLACTLPIYLAFARAGSRAGLLALGVLVVITFLFAEGSRKVLLATMVVIGVGASSFVLPGYIRARFVTIFSSAEGSFDPSMQSRIDSDIASSNERRALLIQSFWMTVKHPIFGVGPGDFSFVARDERVRGGERGGEELVSHNTYTQISSETGFPGIILFVGTVLLAVRFSYGDYRRLLLKDRELALYARYLFTAITGLAVGIFFLSVGYSHLLGTMFALALAFHRIVDSLDWSSPVSGVALQGRFRRSSLPSRSQAAAPSQPRPLPALTQPSAPVRRPVRPARTPYKPAPSSRGV